MEYPVTKWHFQVEWGGTKIGFQDASGFKVTVGDTSYRDGATPESNELKIPTRRKFENITLKRGVFQGDNEFYEWWNTNNVGTVERRDVTISLLNEAHEPIVTWRVKNAWPLSVEQDALSSKSDEVLIETLVLTHEGLTMEHN